MNKVYFSKAFTAMRCVEKQINDLKEGESSECSIPASDQRFRSAVSTLGKRMGRKFSTYKIRDSIMLVTRLPRGNKLIIKHSLHPDFYKISIDDIKKYKKLNKGY